MALPYQPILFDAFMVLTSPQARQYLGELSFPFKPKAGHLYKVKVDNISNANWVQILPKQWGTVGQCWQ